jgi:hypothetical protein
VLYKKRFFEKKTPFFMKEIGLILFGVSYFSAVDYAASEYMWSNCGDVVKKVTNYQDQYFLD